MASSLRRLSRGIALFALAMGVMHAPAARADGEDVAWAAPAGITFQDTYYADGVGMTLYTYKKDVEPGKSTCVGECLKNWQPVAAPAGARPTGHWTLATRDDGTQQWAFDGKPVYTHAGDKAVGDTKGQGLDGGDWLSLRINLDAVLPSLPAGIKVREVADAAGRALVDHRGLTLYVFDGNPAEAAALSSDWLPLDAAEMARQNDLFSIVAGADGRKQWAYKGKPLYLNARDVIPNEAKGVNVDPRVSVALVERYFMPANVMIRSNLGWGTVLATSEGMTLYMLDGFRSLTGAHHSRVANRGVPATGRRIGTGSCDTQCLKTRIPFKAPADAQPSGHWTILTRADGSRQWAYRGYAMYTFTGDKKPGDMIGQNVYIVQVSQSVDKAARDEDLGVAINWHIVYP